MAAASVNVSLDDIDLSTLRVSPLMLGVCYLSVNQWRSLKAGPTQPTCQVNNHYTDATGPPGAVPLKAVRMPPGAVRTPTKIQLLNVQKGTNCTQITCSFCQAQDEHGKNEKECHFTLCRNLYDCKLQNVAPHCGGIITSFMPLWH